MAEAVWVFSAVYDRGERELAAGIEMLLNHEHLVLQDADVVLAALDLFRARPSLGFSDCLMLQLARKALAKVEGAERL